MKHIKIKAQLLKHERGADRFTSALPVEIGGVQGLTRNISATGIYFETEAAQMPGSRVNFTVEMNTRGMKIKLVCQGKVVRVDHNGRVSGIAAKLESSFFSDATEVINFKPDNRTGIPWQQ